MDCQSLALALQDLSTSMQEIASTHHPQASKLVLHRTQCLCLAKSYAIAVQLVMQHLHRFLSTCLDSQKHQDLIPSLSELYHAMSQGRKFLCDCLLQDGWVKKALLLALSTEAQDICFHDLVWCLCVIHQAMGLQLALQPGDDCIYGTLDDIWAADASHDEDMRVLLDTLEGQIACWKLQLILDNHNLSTSSREDINAQSCLAKFLLQRLSKEKQNAASAQSTLDELPHYLRVDPTEITIKKAGIARSAFAVFNKVEWHGVAFGHKQFWEIDGAVFAKEAAIQARLRHPNLLQLVCCTYSMPSDNQYGLLVELMDTNLRNIIEDRQRQGFDPPFSLLTSVDLMLQIAMGMEHLHSLNIIHCDLKSANLLVTNCKLSMDESLTNCQMRMWMRLKIAGFSASKSKNKSSAFTTLRRGTTNWMAPELFQVNPESASEDTKYTKKADVYSFALVCYEILSGDISFDDSEMQAELHQRLLEGERPKLPSRCPPYLAGYIENCWQGDPEKRPSFDQISRAMRHLKGILLSSANPFTSSPTLSTRGLNLIEDNLQQALGVDWLSTAPNLGIAAKVMTIMSRYTVMEGKLAKQKVEESSTMRGTLGHCWSSGFGSVSPTLTQMPQRGVENPERKIQKETASSTQLDKERLNEEINNLDQSYLSPLGAANPNYEALEHPLQKDLTLADMSVVIHGKLPLFPPHHPTDTPNDLTLLLNRQGNQTFEDHDIETYNDTDVSKELKRGHAQVRTLFALPIV